MPYHALLRLFLLAAVGWLAVAAPARAQHLADFLARVSPAQMVPGADRFGPPEGTPPVAPAYAADKLLGWVYLNTDLTSAVGYSGWPIYILVGLSTDWRIAGAKLMEHHEPLLLSGVGVDRIDAVMAAYVGLDVTGITSIAASRPRNVISGASVSMTVMGDSILRSAILLVRQHRPEATRVPPQDTPAPPEAGEDAPIRDWAALLAGGTVRHLRLSVGEVSDAFAGAGFAATRPEREDPAADFLDLYAAPVSPAAIGRSLLGEAAWKRLQATLRPGQAALALFANGAYAYQGDAPKVGPLTRLALIQAGRTIRFTDRDLRRLEGAAAAGAPAFAQADLLVLPEGVAFDPLAPWRLQVLAERGASPPAFLTFDLAWDPPAPASAPVSAPVSATTATAAPDPLDSEPLWVAEWRAQPVRIGILGVALLVLTGVFFFQDRLARHPVALDRFRLVFLGFTLLWIGLYAQAQLSIVNVLAFLSALRGSFAWDAFLLAPLIFILWAATAIAMLFWNRGAYCGWLCPYGAAQELLNRAARALGVRQIVLPHGLHQRLSVLKYVVFVVLFGLSLQSLGTAESAAEVEPFRTIFALRFERTWPFGLYAVVWLVFGLFLNRPFCRYLCPMGAALAIPARLRLFDWLHRLRDCGNPCQRCANECPVQAIAPEGDINPAECIQCLHCQMLYFHEQRCPVRVRQRQRRERHAHPAGPDAA